MEDLYLKRRYTERVTDSELFNFNSIMKSFENVRELVNTDLCELIGVDNRSDLKLLESNCLPPVLTSRNEGNVIYAEGVKKKYEYYDLPKEVTRLKSIEFLKKRTKHQTNELVKALRYPYEVNLELLNEKNRKEFEKNNKHDTSRLSLTPHDEFLLTVRIFGCNGYLNSQNCNGALRVNQDFVCVSSNTLASLKERIICSKDFQPAVQDVSLNPTFPDSLRAKDTFKSSYFYFREGFYYDLQPGESDLSYYARQWFDRNEWPYVVGDMNQVKFKDLKIRLGYPYVYVHQNHCEHLIVFTDVRLLSPTDDLNSSMYPLLKSFSCPKYRACHLCECRAAKFIVADYDRLPRQYVLTCTTCLLRYCYRDQSKIGEFKVYKYVDRVALL